MKGHFELVSRATPTATSPRIEMWRRLSGNGNGSNLGGANSCGHGAAALGGDRARTRPGAASVSREEFGATSSCGGSLGGAGRGCGQGARLPAPAGCQNQLLCWLRASGVAIQGAPDYEPSVSPCDNYTSAYRRMANVGARLLMLMALMMVITSHSGDGLLR